jgi:hypothetical protein
MADEARTTSLSPIEGGEKKVAKLNKSQKDSNELNQFRMRNKDEGSKSEDVDDFSSDPVNNPHLSLALLASVRPLVGGNQILFKRQNAERDETRTRRQKCFSL